MDDIYHTMNDSFKISGETSTKRKLSRHQMAKKAFKTDYNYKSDKIIREANDSNRTIRKLQFAYNKSRHSSTESLNKSTNEYSNAKEVDNKMRSS